MLNVDDRPVKVEEGILEVADERLATAAAEAAYAQFRRFFAGDPSALTPALAALAAVPERTMASPRLAQEVNSLGADLRLAFHESQDGATLDAAIAASAKAIDIAGPASADRPLLLSSLATGLADRFDVSHDPADAGRAEVAARDAVGASRPGEQWWPQLQLSLLRALVARLRSGDTGGVVLGEALAAERELRQSVGPIRDRDPGSAAALDQLAADARFSLARVLLENLAPGGAAADLDAAIDLLGLATAAEATYAVDLVYVLTHRYERSGQISDIDEAVRTGEHALAELGTRDRLPPGLVAALQRNLGIARRARYTVDPDQDRFAGIVAAHEAALAAEEAGAGRARTLVNLANVLADRHAQLGDRPDLERAIDLYQRGLDEGLPDDGRELARVNLALALVERFRRDGTAEDLDRAITLLEGALSAFGPGSSHRPIVQFNLGTALKARWEHDGASEDVVSGVAAYREAAATAATFAPTIVVQVATTWGDWATARGEWPEAAEAYGRGIDALVDLVAVQSGRSGQETWLAAARGLPASAAYALLRTGDVQGAVTSLERGRTVLLSRGLGHPDDVAVDVLPGSGSRVDGPPIVYVAATTSGGFAIILDGALPDRARHEWLDDLDQASLDDRILAYVEAYERRTEDRSAWMATLEATGAWLWTAFVGKLIAALAGRRARVIAVGWLGLLPLHAASEPDPHAPTGRRYALDLLAFEYAPSLRALESAAASSPRAVTSVLVVDDPQPVSAPVLRFAAREAEYATRAGPTHVRLRKHRARHDDVLAALPAADVIHFACHGLANPLEPLESALLLSGNVRLTLREIQGLRLSAQLAVLSACETAMAGFRLTDEVVGFPTGLLHAGVRGVVGSLWSVNDLSTLLLIGRFYEYLLEDRLSPAEALRRAQIWVRDATNREVADRYPHLPEVQPPDGLAPAARAFWLKVRMHRRPYHWAGFAYVGG